MVGSIAHRAHGQMIEEIARMKGESAPQGPGLVFTVVVIVPVEVKGAGVASQLGIPDNGRQVLEFFFQLLSYGEWGVIRPIHLPKS